MKRAYLISLIVLTCAPLVHAQKYILKNNQELLASEVTLSGTNLVKRVKLATGADGVENHPVSSVASLDFPMPDEFDQAREDLMNGKYEAALANAEKVQLTFNLFRSTPGSWWVAGAVLKLEALASLNKLNEFDSLMTELKGMSLSSVDQVYIQAMEAHMDFCKGVTGPAETKVRAILDSESTDDATLLARLWLMLGDIKFKREDFKAAMDSYLHVPVFFGSQGIFLPAAELGAARSLAKLQRYDEASEMMKGIAERYKGTTQATQATQEKVTIDKLQGEVSEATAPPETEPK